MRKILVTVAVVSGAMLTPVAANADVLNCGGPQPVGVLTCSTTGPATIDGTSFVGDGGSSAQLRWVGSLSAPAPGSLVLGYTYQDVYNSLFAKIGMRLTVEQPGCESDDQESHRDWVDLASGGGAGQITVEVSCAGPVNYRITSRAATYSLGGSFIGSVRLDSLAYVASPG